MHTLTHTPGPHQYILLIPKEKPNIRLIKFYLIFHLKISELLLPPPGPF